MENGRIILFKNETNNRASNDERKELDRAITLEALGEIEQNEAQAHRNSTVLFNSSWHKGIIGI